MLFHAVSDIYVGLFFYILFSSKDDIANCFDKLDKDGNGVLTPDEVVSIIQDRLGFDQETAKYMVEMFDQNKDGSLDKSEFMMLWTSMFGE